MRTAHLAAAHVYGGNDHAVGGDFVHQEANAHDVRDGVEGADLMEVNLIDRTACACDSASAMSAYTARASDFTCSGTESVSMMRAMSERPV